MKYVIDNDLHIHSKLSSCSRDPEQTTERILRYAEENNLKTICVTDNFWDDTTGEAEDKWYRPQNFEHISKSKPLPQSDKVRFLFGCETELDRNLKVAISKEHFDAFDFIIIPTTHFHMVGYTLSVEETADAKSRADAWVRRFDAVLKMDLPFRKIGLAHLTCGLIAPTREECIEVLKLLPENEMERLFSKAAELGVGIELNSDDMKFSEDEADIVLRPYRIAKRCGCKFYCGSDVHYARSFAGVKAIFERAIDLLKLSESDKFIIGKN